MQPEPNNGTLRLPLRPVGLHDSEDAVLEEPEDPVTSYSLTTETPMSTPAPETTPVLQVDPLTSSDASGTPTSSPTANAVGVDPADAQETDTASDTTEEETEEHDDANDNANSDEKSVVDKLTSGFQDFWDWLKHKADDLFNGKKKGESEKSDSKSL